MPDRRYLLGILVYNGRDVVPRCLDSAAGIVADGVSVVVFDDCSPSEGWSASVAEMCADRRIGYYRSPRNLGIPRNMSLVMKTALSEGYDIAGLVNSDVVLPSNIIQSMDAVFDSDDTIASVTPWSNNVSAFSLPMADADPEVAEGAFVSLISDSLLAEHGGSTLEIPTGVGYCLMMPTNVIRAVGVMDPIFGRGYCEEVDWCQRARSAGYRNVLSLGSFVYHEGSGTNRDEGLLAHGMTTVIEHELIVRGRYPDYESRVRDFLAGAELERLGRDSLSHALAAAVGTLGYSLIMGDPRITTGSHGDSITLSAAGTTNNARVSLRGMTAGAEMTPGFHPDELIERFGMPERLTVIEPGPAGELYANWARRSGIGVVERLAYPTRL